MLKKTDVHRREGCVGLLRGKIEQANSIRNTKKKRRKGHT